MKMIFSLRKHHHVARVSIFLLTVALIAGMAGCVECGGVIEYDLTISSTAGGNVTIPGEAGPYTYDEREVVNLVAVAEEGYRFVNWTGNVGTIAAVNNATTTITMNGDYNITANFTLSISNIVATPTKIGNAAVITWYTDVPTGNNTVVYGQSSPPRTTSSPGLDNVYEHAVVISGLTPNSTYYYRVGVTYLGLNYVSSVNTFVAENAKNAWNSSVNNYTVNMLITLNWDVTSTSDTFLTTWFMSTNSYMAQAAQDIYDATDGYIRLGTVLVVDRQTEGNAAWNSSDMTFEENIYDSRGGSTPYTYYNGAWFHTPAIENPNGWGMTFGSLGSIRQVGGEYEQWDWNQNTAPDGWGPMYTPGWQARIITHEFGHYALYLPDRYDTRQEETCNTSFITGPETCLQHWDQNISWNCDLMSQLGYWVNNSTFKYYTEFAGYACDDNGDSYFDADPPVTPLPITNNSSWYIIINADPFAGSGIRHYSNAYGGEEPAYPDLEPEDGNGGVFNVIFINN